MDKRLMDESETREYQSVVIAGLLHDIGKLLHRENDLTYKTGHHKTSASFIGDYESKLRNDRLYDLDLVKFFARYHMDKEKKEDVLKDSFFQNSTIDKERAWNLLKIVRDADIYSCAEREHEKAEFKGPDRLEPLRPIFQNIDLSPEGPQPQDRVNYRLNSLRPLEYFPEECEKLSDQDFEHLIDAFKDALPDFSKYDSFDDVINKWVDVLQEYTCCVPSDTQYDGPDVSLYDHSRSSAAFAACLYKRHLESIRNNTQFKRLNKEFMLIGGDYSGIQDYIFHITNRGSGGASKRLRARSFFVYLFSEATIHKILHALDLPLVCNLFSAGGKFLLLAPNVIGVEEKLERVRKEIETEISRTYFNQFAFLLSWMEINGYKKGPELQNELGIYTFYKSAEDMFYRLETEKLKKFHSILVDERSATWRPEAFKAREMYAKYEETGDCKICGRGPGTEKDIDPDTKEVTMCCQICYRDKYEIGEELPKTRLIAFGKGVFGADHAKGRIALFNPVDSDDDTIQDGYYAELIRTLGDVRPDHYLVYSIESDGDAKNVIARRPILQKHYANHVPVEDNRILSFEQIAEKSLWNKDGKTYGSDMLGILKVDIDNLGLAFSKGFEKPSRLERGLPDIDRKTVSRFLTLSRMIDLFFSGWIKDIMTNDKEIVIKQLLEIKNIDHNSFEQYLRSDFIDFRNIYTVYSGGDDLVLVGPWETVILFALYMNNQFRKYTCENDYLTLSAGLAFVKDRHPIADAIKQADTCLELSKRHGKNRITLFGTTLPWKMMNKLISFFLFLNGRLEKNDDRINMSFAYKLLQHHWMALTFLDEGKTDGLKYVSNLSYDIGRNIVKRDKDGRIVEGKEEFLILQELISSKPDKSSLMYHLKIPLFWAIYRNRRWP